MELVLAMCCCCRLHNCEIGVNTEAVTDWARGAAFNGGNDGAFAAFTNTDEVLVVDGTSVGSGGDSGVAVAVVVCVPLKSANVAGRNTDAVTDLGRFSSSDFARSKFLLLETLVLLLLLLVLLSLPFKQFDCKF